MRHLNLTTKAAEHLAASNSMVFDGDTIKSLTGKRWDEVTVYATFHDIRLLEFVDTVESLRSRLATGFANIEIKLVPAKGKNEPSAPPPMRMRSAADYHEPAKAMSASDAHHYDRGILIARRNLRNENRALLGRLFSDSDEFKLARALLLAHGDELDEYGFIVKRKEEQKTEPDVRSACAVRIESLEERTATAIGDLANRIGTLEATVRALRDPGCDACGSLRQLVRSGDGWEKRICPRCLPGREAPPTGPASATTVSGVARALRGKADAANERWLALFELICGHASQLDKLLASHRTAEALEREIAAMASDLRDRTAKLTGLEK